MWFLWPLVLDHLRFKNIWQRRKLIKILADVINFKLWPVFYDLEICLALSIDTGGGWVKISGIYLFKEHKLGTLNDTKVNYTIIIWTPSKCMSMF